MQLTPGQVCQKACSGIRHRCGWSDGVVFKLTFLVPRNYGWDSVTLERAILDRVPPQPAVNSEPTSLNLANPPEIVRWITKIPFLGHHVN